MAPAPKPTWRQIDALENTQAKAGAEVDDFLERLGQLIPYATVTADLKRQKAAVMKAAQDLTDAMRDARITASAIVVAHRGYRK